MKFISNISNAELVRAYTDSLKETELAILTEVLNIRQDPETFEYADLDAIEASTPETEVHTLHRISVIRELKTRVDSLKNKIEALS